MKLMNTSHSFTESVESNIKKRLTKTVIPGLMLQITGYVLYLYCNSLLASVMVIICFLTVIPPVLIVFKIDSALEVIKKGKEHFMNVIWKEESKITSQPNERYCV